MHMMRLILQQLLRFVIPGIGLVVLLCFHVGCTEQREGTHGGTAQFKEKAERTEKHALDLREKESIRLELTTGAIDIQVVTDGEPGVSGTLTVHAPTEEDAKKILEKFQLKVERTATLWLRPV